MTTYGVSTNYGGRQASGSTSVSVKTFYEGITSLWTQTRISGFSAITPTTLKSLYIPLNIYCTNIFFISDAKVKENIMPINTEITNKIMNLKPRSFTFKSDAKKLQHYGFIAQDIEPELPNLIYEKPDKTHGVLKTVNYLEIIPLLVNKIQMMQKEIDELKEKINSKETCIEEL